MSYSSELKEYLRGIEIKKACCKKAYQAGLELKKADIVCEKDAGCYLRGIFVACGSMTDPDKQFYVSFSGKSAPFAADALTACGITPLYGKRKGNDIVYIRENEAISDFLAASGASKNALELMEISVLNSMKRDANRKNNADLANLDKAATASAEVREAIMSIKKHKDYSKLPEELRETAELRLENPSLTLEELRLIHPKPISKSGLYHRIKRLVEFSFKYK